MMKIKIFLAVLAFVLVLTGCGDGSNKENDTVQSDEIITDIEIDEAVNPEGFEETDVIPLSAEVILPENINTEDLVDTENEIKATVSGTTKEATRQYVQTLLDAGYNLDYEFEAQEGAQFGLSTHEFMVSIVFKNDEMMIFVTRLE